MFQHLLVPMDGSVLAECVLPHVMALASAMGARVTLLHVLETPHEQGGGQAIDPVEWHLKKREAHGYLEQIASQLQGAQMAPEKVILEGVSADCIIDYTCSHDVDLVVLSSHGHSGLSGWNISSVVQKIILRCCKSVFLVRAFYPTAKDASEVRYQRLFVGMDCSARADYVLPFAVRLAQYYKSRLTLGTVVQRPEILQRSPLSKADAALVNGVAEKNRQWATHYLQQLQTQFSMAGIDLQTRLAISDHPIAALHDMVEQEQADLVLLVAHGQGGTGRYPYGSMATSFIAFGNTSLMIMQDLSDEEIHLTQGVARQAKGH